MENKGFFARFRVTRKSTYGEHPPDDKICFHVHRTIEEALPCAREIFGEVIDLSTSEAVACPL